MADLDELNLHKTNPKLADTDGDGLTDGEEVNTYKTNPLLVDTDGDGLSDWDEINTYKTNPLLADTDGDGLSDWTEIKKSKTNPLVVDTDKDNTDDGDEVAVGTDPNNPEDFPTETIAPVIITPVLKKAYAKAGTEVIFRVKASGVPLNYQWYRGQGSKVVAERFKIEGATTNTLRIPDMKSSDAGAYTVAVFNEAGAVTSSGYLTFISAKPKMSYVPTRFDLVYLSLIHI